MEIRFATPELRTIDTLRLDALSLAFFEDERPLRGLVGEIDWRLCGELSLWIVRGRIAGREGERVMMPSGRRLGPERLLLHGLGAREAFLQAKGEGLQHALRDMLGTLARGGFRSAAICLPPTLPDQGNADSVKAHAMQVLLEVAGAVSTGVDEMVVLEKPDAQRAMQPVVDNARRRARVGG